MFDVQKRVTQVKRFQTDSGKNRFEKVNEFLKNKDVEYVDLKTEEGSVLILIYTIPAT